MKNITLDRSEFQPVGFELKVQQLDGDTADAVVKIRWCLSPDLVETLRHLDAAEAAVLVLVTAAEGKRERRFSFRLDQEIGMIYFTSPGENKISAVISTNKDDLVHFTAQRKTGEYVNHYSKENGIFSESLLHIDDDVLPYIALHDTIVPEAMFAKPPAQWVQDWTAHFGRGKAVDQCANRRKVLLTVPLIPIVVPFWLVLKLAICFWCFAILGRRGHYPAQMLLHPMEQPPFIPLKEPSFWLETKDGKPREGANSAIIMLHPLAFLAYGVLILGAWFLATQTAPFVLPLILVLAVIVGLVLFFGGAIREAFKAAMRVKERAAAKQAEKAKEEKLAQLSFLNCANINQRDPFDLSTKNTKTKKTYLYFRQSKAKVCKPYAK